MKKLAIIAFAIMFGLTLSSFAAAATDYVGVAEGDKFEWDFELTGTLGGEDGSITAVFSLEIDGVAEETGIGALVSGTMTISDVKATGGAEGVEDDIMGGEDTLDAEIPVFDDESLYTDEVLMAGFFVINKDAEKSASGDEELYGIKITWSVSYNADGVLESWEMTQEMDADNILTTTYTLKGGIPGYPLAFVLLAAIAGMGVLIRKRH